MKVLLIYPPYPYESVSTFEEPLGLLYLASSLLAAGFQVDVADLTFNPQMKGLLPRVLWADVVGISASTPLFGAAKAVLRAVREIDPTMFVVAGGPHVTAKPSDALDVGFDAVVIGEGENTAPEVFAAASNREQLAEVRGIAFLENGEMRTNLPREFVSNLDDLPFPARRFIDYSRYRRMGLISMRGCPYRCIYCKPVEDRLFGKKLRKRSPENVVDEIDGMLRDVGNRLISFKDDTFTVNQTEWFARLREELERRHLKIAWQCSSRVDSVSVPKLKLMKEAGCQQIFFGVESGAQRILDYYRKDIQVEDTRSAFEMCRSVGIRACASIMLGAPMETRRDLELTYQLVRAIKPFNWHVHVTTPICGSYLYEQVKDAQRLTIADDFSHAAPTGNIYRLSLPMKLDHLSQSDIGEFRDRINRYMKFRLLTHCICKPSLWRELLVSRGFRAIAFNFLRRHFTRRPKLAPANG